MFVHQFAPHGVSGIAMIAESHLAIHTWPEYGYMAADFFTCGEGADVEAAIEVLRAAFEAEHVECRHLTRGVPPDVGRRFEEHEPGSASHAAYDVLQVLEQRRTEFQEIMLFEAPRLGRVLALDGIVQMTDLDTYVYHEMLAHPALFSHPNPRTVAVVGGGDVYLVAEILKHPGIERVYLLEHDSEAHKLGFPDVVVTQGIPLAPTSQSSVRTAATAMLEPVKIPLTILEGPREEFRATFAALSDALDDCAAR